MKQATLVVRLLLGLVFTVFGLNGFLHFLPMPPQEGVLAEMFTTYSHMGYMFPVIFGTQLVSGILLLTNMYAALAVVLLAPVIVHILLVHAFLDPKGLPVALVVFAMEVFLAYAYRAKYRPLLAAK